MKVKVVENISVAYVERTSTIPDIKVISGACCEQIELTALSQGVKIIGPWILVAQHFPYDSKTKFTIRF